MGTWAVCAALTACALVAHGPDNKLAAGPCEVQSNTHSLPDDAAGR